MCEACIQLGIPERLCRNNRPLLKISRDDILFRRVPAQLFPDRKASEKVSAVAFPLRNDSYNLESQCESPDDVLFSILPDVPHYLDHGIIKIDLGDLWDASFEYSGGKETYRCRFEFDHEPEDCMYPHSEIKVYINDVLKNPISSKDAKTALRLKLHENHSIVKFPEEFEGDDDDDDDDDDGDELLPEHDIKLI